MKRTFLEWVGVFAVLAVATAIGMAMLVAWFQAKPFGPSGPRPRSEMSQLEFAMGRVAAELGNGHYPPTDPVASDAYWKKVFPNGPPRPAAASDPAEALVFWLSGPNGTMSIFDFDPARLRNGKYFPPNDVPGSDPYVYFGSDGNGNYVGQVGNVRPYVDSRTGKFCNPRSYQILCPGMDGKYGTNNTFPAPADSDQESRDDLANFWTGKIGDSRGEVSGGEQFASGLSILGYLVACVFGYLLVGYLYRRIAWGLFGWSPRTRAGVILERILVAPIAGKGRRATGSDGHEGGAI